MSDYPAPDWTRAQIEAWEEAKREARLMPLARAVADVILHGKKPRCSACNTVGHRANSPLCVLNTTCPKCGGQGHIDPQRSCPSRGKP